MILHKKITCRMKIRIQLVFIIWEFLVLSEPTESSFRIEQNDPREILLYFPWSFPYSYNTVRKVSLKQLQSSLKS